MMDLMLRRRGLMVHQNGEPIAISYADNPQMMTVLYNKGISPRLEYITVKEAESYTGGMDLSMTYPAFLDHRHFINAAIGQVYSASSHVKKYCFPAKPTNLFARLGAKTDTVIIPLGCTLTGTYQIQGRRVNPTIDVIIEDSVPENIGNFQVWSVTLRNIYVPDDAVELYKTKLSSFASKILPMSEWVEPEPQTD